MKKIISIAAVAIAAISMASAAPFIGIRGSFGMGLGSTFANEDSNDAEKPFDQNMTFGGGAFLNIPLGHRGFGLQAGADFSRNMIGTKNETTILGSTITSKRTITYDSIDIPVMLTYQHESFKIGVGPYLSFPIGEMSDDIGIDKPGKTEITSTMIFGLEADADFLVDIGPGYLTIGGGYKLDFTPVEIKGPGDKNTEVFTRRAARLNLGYILEF